MDRLLEEPPSQEVVDRILDFYFQVRDFLNISELVLALAQEECQVLSLHEKDESLESYYVNLMGGASHE